MPSSEKVRCQFSISFQRAADEGLGIRGVTKGSVWITGHQHLELSSTETPHWYEWTPLHGAMTQSGTVHVKETAKCALLLQLEELEADLWQLWICPW